MVAIIASMWLCVACKYATAQQNCIACHSKRELSIKLPDGSIQSLYVDQERFASSVHGRFDCVDCHTNMRHKIQGAPSHAVHGSTLGVIPKEVEPLVRHMPKALQQALASCADCHKEQFKAYATSIHARHLKSGCADAPMCADCHGSHYILPNEDERSPAYRGNIPHMCAVCHANEALMRKHGLNPYTVTTYLNSFHGKKLRLGSNRSPTCTTCHSHHAIASPHEPSSPMHPKNKAGVCASCHAGGGRKFSLTFTHKPASPVERPIAYWVDMLFGVFVIVVLIPMFAYTLLDALIMCVLLCTGALDKELEGVEGHVRRWDVHQIIQHLLFMGSVMLLMLSGLPLKGSGGMLAPIIMRLLGGTDSAGLLHRVAGMLMLFAVAYHLLYLFIRFLLGYRRTEMLPSFKDFVDFYQMLLFLLRLRCEPPKMGRYNFIEKFLYWAAGWGIIMMGITGMMLWRAQFVAEHLSPQLVEIAQAVHSHEAVLATFALLCFHVYFAHLRPDVFPMSMVWLTGKISLKEMKLRHALEYEQHEHRQLDG